MPGRLHHEFNRVNQLNATNCDGRIRRAYVRVGTARLYVPVARICDKCGAYALDQEASAAIEEASRLGTSGGPLDQRRRRRTRSSAPPRKRGVGARKRQEGGSAEA